MKTSKAIDICAITIGLLKDCYIMDLFRNWLRQIRCSDPHVHLVHCGSTLRSSSLLQKISHYAAISLILGECNSIELELNYNFKEFDISTEEIVGCSWMEIETMHYEIQYAEKKIELKKAYYEFVKAYKKEQYGTEHIDVRLERLQTTEEQEKEFERFIESYADKQPCLGCRASWYHHYGHLIDMIDLRIKHLKIHISQNNVIEHQDYNLKTFDVSDDELVGHTFAELENKDYTKQYHEKKIDLKKAYDEFVKRSGMGDAAVDQQKEFERFIESYAKKNQCMYLRSAWYHYCGALVDMIDLRIKHLKIYTAWYSGDT